jgi:hypothetical protein
MGSVFGIVAMIAALGMALGPLAVRPARRVWVALYRVIRDRYRARIDGDDPTTAPPRPAVLAAAA